MYCVISLYKEEYQLLTRVVLAVVAHTSTSHLIAVGEWIHTGIIVTASGMVVTVTRLAGEGVVRCTVSPWLVVVEGKTSLTVVSLRVVQAITDGVNVVTTAAGMAIASTPI